jgi:NAD(P)-dependent dehydrogenase (short-subunit alcohol dehydrogenase family)
MIAATRCSMQRDYKVALVTGGNSGIGYQTAKALSLQGYYVVLGCRDAAKAATAKARLLEEVPSNRGVELASFNLADLDTVRDFGRRARDRGLPLDCLVLNAGVMAPPKMEV